MNRLLWRVGATALVAIAGSLGFGGPAQAGGWATTLLDPLPARLEVGTTYTVGFWVLQHGSHPYDGELGRTGLRLVDERGRSTEFAGRALPEAAHYAAAVVFTRAGGWRLYGVQGVFSDCEIGTVTVPGGLRVLPTPEPMPMDEGHGAHWGAIHPPLAGMKAPAPAMPTQSVPVGRAGEAANPDRGSPVPWMPPVIAVGATLALVGTVAVGIHELRRQSRRPGVSHSVDG